MKVTIAVSLLLFALAGIVMTAVLFKREIKGLYNQYRPLLLDGGGENCLRSLRKRGVDFKEIGHSGSDICPIRNAVRVSKFRGTTPSGPFILSCSTALNLTQWIEDYNINRLSHMGTINCRKMQGRGVLSEHSFGTAIDIASVNGASVKKDWGANTANGQLLATVAKGACKYFSNVLTPKTNRLHHDHFHFDNGLGRRC